MTTVYVELLDEGVTEWRPVESDPVSTSGYRLPSIAPDEEVWAYPPGSLVRCEVGQDGLLYAVEQIPPE
jgi:hypothetical protein